MKKKVLISGGPFLKNLGHNANEVLRIEVHGTITPTRPDLLCMVSIGP